MNNLIIEAVETIEVIENENLNAIIKDSKIDESLAFGLKTFFAQFNKKIAELQLRADEINITDVSQKAEIKKAHSIWSESKNIRIDIEKSRKEKKEVSLRYGQAIDAVAKLSTLCVLPIEQRMKDQKDFAEILESKRKAEIKINRENELRPFAEFIPFGIDLGSMTDDDFAKVLSGAKLQLQAKHENEIRENAERERLELERIENERIETERRKAIEAENARLKAEADAKAKELELERAKAKAEADAIEAEREKERAAAENQIRLERIAKEKELEQIRAENGAKELASKQEQAKKDAEIAKIQAELQAKKDAEIKAYELEQEKLRLEKLAPDKEKLNAYLNGLFSLSLPEIKDKNLLDLHNSFIGELHILVAKYQSKI